MKIKMLKRICKIVSTKRSMRLLNFCLLIFCISCNTKGHRGASLSVPDSKERNTYLYTCSISTSSAKTDDYVLPKIKEVFVEKSWFVGNSANTHDSEFLNLVIITNNDAFFEEHAIGNFTFTYKNTMIFNLDRSQFTDTLTFGLYKWDNFYTRDKGEKICDIYIVKKD